MKEEYYSVKQVAEILGLSPETIRRMIRNGDLFAFKIGTGKIKPTYRITSDELIRLQIVGYKNKED